MIFGSLFSGAVASRLGAPATFAICGIICLVAALSFGRVLPGLQKHVRPIYERKGLYPLPEVE